MLYRKPSTTSCRSWLACCSASRGAVCSACSTSSRSGSLNLSSLSTASCSEPSQCLSERPCAVSATRCSRRQRTHCVTCQSRAPYNHCTPPSVMVTIATITTSSSSSRLSSGSDMSREIALCEWLTCHPSQADSKSILGTVSNPVMRTIVTFS